MSVTLMRIDDRLIHGQIVTAWLADSRAAAILVADDIAANDPTQKMLLQLTTPQHVKLYVETIDEASKLLNSNTITESIFLIVRNPKTANQLFETGFKMDVINVGNISNSKSVTGRKRLLPYLYLEKEDVENLKQIAEKGIKLDVRSVPSDRTIDGVELITKTY
ncbi:PTS system mannose/fructose/N-acetylgalactosamine-transporter subunit IIB [Neobacillus kokaensis]|uniref:PTS fructose transporter subunit IIB n=1 Tax=Neobacillus kokaensis TaxID=2759023 RepID=A0ABQ3N555_9BACI|nr:PTS sugar transporter subunit IIB [Neobacillus kokaensis]GHH98628.1 PTS fructose transporter subunit IIB [Neobacillus kokaensis]